MIFAISLFYEMHRAVFISEALRREGLDLQQPHHAGLDRSLADALRFVGYVAPSAPRPSLCHVLAVAFLIEPMTKMRLRVYEESGFPHPSKLPALMRLWCSRLPTWSPEKAHEALLSVRPFGSETGLVALIVYQWIRGTWSSPELPPSKAC